MALVSGDMRVHRLAQLVRCGLMGSESVRGAVDADDGGAVQQPVQHRCGDGRVPESCCPVGDPDVRGALEVALVDHLEQRRRAVTGQRQMAELVDLCRARSSVNVGVLRRSPSRVRVNVPGFPVVLVGLCSNLVSPVALSEKVVVTTSAVAERRGISEAANLVGACHAKCVSRRCTKIDCPDGRSEGTPSDTEHILS